MTSNTGGTLDGRRWLARVTRGLVCLASVSVMTSCQGSPTGPSLTNLLLQPPLSLQVTSQTASLCCCRVVGTATNRNDVPVHVTMKFSAFDGQQSDPIARILYFIKDLQPFAPHAISAPAFLLPCLSIAELKTEITVNGIVFPSE